jgi:hypothetical protein
LFPLVGGRLNPVLIRLAGVGIGLLSSGLGRVCLVDSPMGILLPTNNFPLESINSPLGNS